MKVLSLKIKDEVFQEMEKTVKEIRMPRNAYINKAVELYNKLNRKQRIKNELRKASRLVGGESLKVAEELACLDNHFLEPYDD